MDGDRLILLLQIAVVTLACTGLITLAAWYAWRREERRQERVRVQQTLILLRKYGLVDDEGNRTEEAP